MAKENYSEKVSVNINTSTLSEIDLLVDNGYYSNRSDFINQALRDALQKHQGTIERIIDRNLEKDPKRWFIGVCSLGNDEILEAKKHGQQITYSGYGVLAIDESIDEETLFSVVQNLKIKGKVICSKTIKEHYGIK